MCKANNLHRLIHHANDPFTKRYAQFVYFPLNH